MKGSTYSLKMLLHKISRPFKKNFKLRIWPENFIHDETACTGEQLGQLVHTIRDIVPDYQWFVADINYNDRSDDLLLDLEYELSKIGDIDDFIKFTSMISQFLSGVFLGLSPKNPSKLNWKSLNGFFTEDPKHFLHCSDIDIRAFDTCYFLVYTNRKELVTALCDRFPKIEIVY